MPKLCGLFRPPFDTVGIEKYIHEKKHLEDVNTFKRKHCFTVACGLISIWSNIKQHLKNKPYLNIFKPSKTQRPKGEISNNSEDPQMSITFPSLGCLDLFRSKASSIISRASRCSTPAVPTRGEKSRKPFLFNIRHTIFAPAKTISIIWWHAPKTARNQEQ